MDTQRAHRVVRFLWLFLLFPSVAVFAIFLAGAFNGFQKPIAGDVYPILAIALFLVCYNVVWRGVYMMIDVIWTNDEDRPR